MKDRLVYVYKSSRKLRTYLYLEERDNFSKLPGGLLDAFGAPKFVMVFSMAKHPRLPKITPEELERSLNERGYLLRIDLEDEEENLLNEERRLRGLPPLTREQIDGFFH
ncbi:MAG: YcgL domain-containing protein [Aeromonadales bacterium]|nr:YcgL domain-containing protein [Aeromonadales bacterium]MDY2890528.1 YcgL domain-containing protein [Succinivibrio sp.]